MSWLSCTTNFTFIWLNCSFIWEECKLIDWGFGAQVLFTHTLGLLGWCLRCYALSMFKSASLFIRNRAFIWFFWYLFKSYFLYIWFWVIVKTILTNLEQVVFVFAYWTKWFHIIVLGIMVIGFVLMLHVYLNNIFYFTSLIGWF